MDGDWSSDVCSSDLCSKSVLTQRKTASISDVAAAVLGCRMSSATALTSGFGAQLRYHKHGRRVVPRSTKGRARRLTSKQRTNERRNLVTWRTIFYWDSRLAGGRRILRTTKRRLLLQGILSGTLWVRELCKGAGNLAAGYPLKTSSTTTVQGRAQLRAAWVKEQF